MSPTNMSLQVLAYSSNQHYHFIPFYTSGAIQIAVMTGLQLDQQYYYSVGSSGGDWSSPVSFSNNRELPIKVIVTGDIGDVAESRKVVGKMLQVRDTYGEHHFLS
jgi:hypothetical protein